ncbi:palmitylated EEv envelope protein [Cetacean poxvirus 1]|nr:palmitylated EEv envelope protein [Cetacean poxvirus 1]
MWCCFKKAPPGADCRFVETIPKDTQLISTYMSTFECFNEIIVKAKKSIGIVSFCCNLTSSNEGLLIMNGLIDAAKRGIKITILVDEQSKDNNVEELTDAGVNYLKIRMGKKYNDGVLLGSFWISDDERCYIGNASLTGGSISLIKTLGMYSEYCSLVKDLHNRFNTFKALEFDTSFCSKINTVCCMPLSTEYHMYKQLGGVFFTDSPERVIGCYRTLDADAVISNINSAKTSICLEILSLVPVIKNEDGSVTFWPEIFIAIISAAINRNVKVRILISNWTKNDAYSMSSVRSMHEMCLNNDLTVKVFSHQNNTKLLIVDGKFGHITSSNFDGTHYLKHGFVSINFTDKELVDTLLKIFERDWTSKHSTALNYN